METMSRLHFPCKPIAEQTLSVQIWVLRNVHGFQTEGCLNKFRAAALEHCIFHLKVCSVSLSKY